jgi:saccharopine dehydrogenase-like NADP-dependent oxidoreductase
MNVIVLGCGLVGGPAALDLARGGEWEVTVVDVDEAPFRRVRENPAIRTVRRDLGNPDAVRELVRPFDFVLSAVPGFLGFQTLRAVIETGRPVVDIAFAAEDPFGLDETARAMGVTAVVDCGVAPGMSNLLVAHACGRLDETTGVLIYVGGLPQLREWPYEYKAVFSPADVIEEYIRPARFVENGRLVVRPALSDPEFIQVPGLGTLEAFNTDGLRTLARTLDVPNMKEKTLRYPGHIDKIAVLRETGFFDTTPVMVQGTAVRPIDVTAKILFPKWTLHEGEADLTVMRIEVTGTKDGRPARWVYDLFDKYDPATGIHSMARTTGYAATMTIRLLAAGLFSRPGICPPEFIGRDPAAVEFILAGLRKRGVIYRESFG